MKCVMNEKRKTPPKTLPANTRGNPTKVVRAVLHIMKPCRIKA